MLVTTFLKAFNLVNSTYAMINEKTKKAVLVPPKKGRYGSKKIVTTAKKSSSLSNALEIYSLVNILNANLNFIGFSELKK